jgi:hypothetical protein
VTRFAPAALGLAVLALTACSSKPGPEDPAVAVATGIPVGAPNATGVRFDPPPSGRAAPLGHGVDDEDDDDGPHPLPKALPLPPDPFDPMGGADAGSHPLPLPPPVHVKPKKPGMTL